jgi:hypothetical protein
LEYIVITNSYFCGDGLQSRLLEMTSQEEESKTNDAKKNTKQ